MMEKYLLDKMKSIIGYTSGDAQMFPGGSISNMQAMSIARYQYMFFIFFLKIFSTTVKRFLKLKTKFKILKKKVRNATFNRNECYKLTINFPQAIKFLNHKLLNLNIIIISRHPNFKEEGHYGGKLLVAFVSEEAHYSTNKAAATLGIGTKNLKKIDTDEK